MNQLHLYNTLTRKVEPFVPLKTKQVGLYTCGPTVYDFQHIGNYRTFLFEDILKRVLLADGYQVNHVMNITDVGHLVSDADEGEDKLEKGARREGKTAWEVAEFYTQAFKQDLVVLNILPASKLVRATEHIQEQIDLIQALEKKGVTYKIADGVYMDTSKVKDYGKLVGLKAKGLKAGARVDMVKGKKHPTDFALWKFSPEGSKRDMEWESPWGVGFPGWHLECSAMAMKYLGKTFDIHCGGVDHAPIHHTNEIAQSETATGKPFAQMWCHGEFLLMDGGKMAKSSGGFITLKNLAEHQVSPLGYRYFTFSAHWRSKLSFSWEALQAAQSAYDRLLELAADWDEPKIGCAEFEQQFMDAVNDDLNMPQALAVVWKLVKSDYPDSAKLESLLKFDEVLGLDIARQAERIRQERKHIPEKVVGLVKERDLARTEKRFAVADSLRDEIKHTGFNIMDTPEGTRLRKIA
ncbi:MAG: cysteine--tRNA ligase [Patescibacteria group bacterium]